MSRGPTTPTELADAVSLLRDVCTRLEPGAVDVVDVEAVFDALVAGQRLLGGAVTRFAARYAEAGGWRRSGAKSVEDAIGAKTGVSVTQARRQLATSKRLGTQRGTDDALRVGAVSGDQAFEVTAAVEIAPQSEAELLRSARLEPIRQLRQRTAAAIAAADADREATYRRLRRQRCLRRWNDADGMGNLLLKLPADEMAEIEDEQCEIAGVGPVSVTAVRRLLSDAFLAIVIKDGVDIRNVTHLGRQVTAHQRTALETRGGACEFCGSTFRVEIDHIKGWALTHTTHIDDLSYKCWTCHEQKTRLGLRETGPPGNRTFLNPDSTPYQHTAAVEIRPTLAISDGAPGSPAAPDAGDTEYADGVALDRAHDHVDRGAGDCVERGEPLKLFA